MNDDTLLRFHALRQGLAEEKAALQKRLKNIDDVLGFGACEPEATPPAVAVTKKKVPSAGKPKAKRAARGALKEGIVGELQKAGEAGLSIPTIAGNLGVKETNVRAWFYATGKKIKNIKKVARGVFAWAA